MLHLAHASLSHWLERDDCDADKLATGYWLLSRVYSKLNKGDEALIYANILLTLSTENKLSENQLCGAYEVFSRAHLVNDNIEEAKAYKAKAYQLLGSESKLTEEEKKYIRLDLEEIVLPE